MKRKSIVKTLALAMAITLAAAPMASITVHAGNNGINDGCVGEDGKGHGVPGHISFDDDDDDAVTEDLGRQEGATFNAGSDAGGSNAGGNGDSGNYGGGSDSYSVSSGNGGGSYAGGSESTGSGNGQAPTGLALKGSTVSVPGYETWRQVANPVSGTFSVYHCGDEQYTLQLKDADGKAVSYKGAALLQTEDGKWYINITTAGTTGLTVNTKKGTAGYLPKLGISGVMLNGTVAVDAEN